MSNILISIYYVRFSIPTIVTGLDVRWRYVYSSLYLSHNVRRCDVCHFLSCKISIRFNCHQYAFRTSWCYTPNGVTVSVQHMGRHRHDFVFKLPKEGIWLHWTMRLMPSVAYTRVPQTWEYDRIQCVVMHECFKVQVNHLIPFVQCFLSVRVALIVQTKRLFLDIK